MAEAQLIAAAKNNDQAAQKRLFDLYRSYWYSICLRYNKNNFDADDCLQNALVKIFTRMHQFDDTKGSFKSWSSQIVVNANLMFLRKEKSRPFMDEVEEHHSLAVAKESDDDVLSPERLTKMLQKLPFGYRTVFNMYVMEGFSHAEIAEILEISEGTSKSQLSKARKLLQLQLEFVL